jgi:hypothetical protein
VFRETVSDGYPSHSTVMDTSTFGFRDRCDPKLDLRQSWQKPQMSPLWQQERITNNRPDFDFGLLSKSYTAPDPMRRDNNAESIFTESEHKGIDGERKRWKVLLDEDKAREIYCARPRDNHSTESLRLAKQYSVSAKAIRDIWNHETWVRATQPLWPPDSAMDTAKSRTLDSLSQLAAGSMLYQRNSEQILTHGISPLEKMHQPSERPPQLPPLSELTKMALSSLLS